MADQRLQGGDAVDTLDFVDQKAAQEVRRLAQQERAILAALPDLIFELSPEGVHVGFHAPRMESLYVPPADLLGRSIHEVLPPDVAAIYQGAIDRTLATEQMQVFEYRLAFPGRMRVYEARMVWKTAGEVLAVVRDVTERHELEERLRQAQKMDAIGQLAGGIAHDFNNLLTVINGFTAMALDGEVSADTRELLSEVARAGERAANLTRQLLMFSRDQVFEPRVVNLNAVISETERMLRRLIGEDVELSTTLEPDLPSVLMDPGQLEQVLINLCLNARDAMTPGGGQLTIATGGKVVTPLLGEDGPAPGAYVVLTVTDTGAGMSEEVRARIFEPFFTTKAAGTGTGLGLAVVFGAVRQAGGFIEVDTAVGRGTTLHVHLPAHAAEITSSSELQEGTALLRGHETILLVEDDPSVRALATRIMARCGYRVIEASNGRQAIEILAGIDGPLDLILTDVVMPEVNGRELAEAAAQLRPGVAIVFMSGYTDDEVFLRGVHSAEVAFVMKPFTAEALSSRVRQELDARRIGNPELNKP